MIRDHPTRNDPACTLRDFCETSSCAGVPDLYLARHKIGRCFWGLVVTGALLATAAQTFLSAQYYMQGNFQSVIKTQSMSQADFKFPNVTVCNFNRANATRMRDQKLDQRIFEYAYGAVAVSYDLPMIMLEDKPEFADELREYERLWRQYSDDYWNGSDPDIGSMLSTFGHDCSASILRILFEGEQMNNSNCFGAVEVINSMGRCWMYISNVVPGIPGPAAGLKLLLNPGLIDYSDSILNNYLEEGMVLAIGYVHEPLSSSPVVLQPGTHAYVALSATTQRYVEEDFPMFDLPCTKKTDLTFADEYSLINCKLDCYSNWSQHHCGCVPVFNPKPGYRSCSPKEVMNCALDLWDRKYLNNTSNTHPTSIVDIDETCMPNCKNPCSNFTTFATSVSVTTFRKTARDQLVPLFLAIAADAIPNGVNLSRFRVDDFIEVSIYFPNLEVVVIEIKEETPIFTFVANVGGLVGLWTGVCVISVVQVIYYFLDEIVRRLLNRKISQVNTIVVSSANNRANLWTPALD